MAEERALVLKLSFEEHKSAAASAPLTHFYRPRIVVGGLPGTFRKTENRTFSKVRVDDISSTVNLSYLA